MAVLEKQGFHDRIRTANPQKLIFDQVSALFWRDELLQATIRLKLRFFSIFLL